MIILLNKDVERIHVNNRRMGIKRWDTMVIVVDVVITKMRRLIRVRQSTASVTR